MNKKPVEPMLCPTLNKAIADSVDDGRFLADSIVADADAARATDIHVDPRRDGYTVRFRIDGGLHLAATLPLDLGEAMSRAIEVAADIDLTTSAHRREGRAKLGAGDTSLRVAVAASVQGSKLSIRLLEASRVGHDVNELGMARSDEKALLDWAGSAEGMLLSVGPTGCGKTTTCYSLLNEMMGDDRNIITLEDPVEFMVDGLTQIQLDSKDHNRPANFSDGIKGALRHDPDAIFLGEIRDEPTAHAAISASFSGRPLLSTMHARDPVSAITLLRSMGVKDYEIAASLRIVIGQRIVRLLCEECREMTEPTPAVKAIMQDLAIETAHVWSVGGCKSCSGTGYRGLTAIFELWRLEMDDFEAILAQSNQNQLRSRLREKGIESLAKAAFRQLAEGRIGLADAMRLL